MDIKNIDLKKGKEFNINLVILKLMSEGMTQKEISEYLKRKGIKPNSFSIIDKRLKAMRKELKCKTVFQMMYRVGKMKLV